MKISALTDVASVKSYLARIGAEARSLRTAVIKQMNGKYWKDIAIIRFSKGGEVTASEDEFLPTDGEAQAIKDDFANITWPQIRLIDRLVSPLPPMLSHAKDDQIFEFRDENNKIVMVQVRVEHEGEKSYVPWTFWDDDQWRCCEPDGPLPLYNANKMKDASTVFIHEGAKAARAVQQMVEGELKAERDKLEAHPWGQQLRGAVHVGWIGGALSPYRTDWSAIMKAGIKRAYIVADNDQPGRTAVPRISQSLQIPTFMIQFTDEFPVSFDLADPFPKSMFGSIDKQINYVGPAFRDCLHPATWATDLIPNPKGKPTAVLRDSFRNMWAYVEEADLFVCTEMPEILRQEAILNKMLAPFSHVAETSRLIVKAYRGRSTRICYRPDHDGLMVTFRGSSAINLHVKCQIPAADGDVKPWLDFLEYVFVNEAERREVMRWCATLIARPDIRMGYGLLLVSERQGIGKTTLGSHILAPLVGLQNVGYPGENDIANSSFNDWMANKRLVVVNEIYSGSSWKAYHALKSVITDRDVTVNQKYMRQFTIENWCHVLACSNSMRALKMENDDRRWFYPEITEAPWTREKFVGLRKWIEGGGLMIIKRWAQTYKDYVSPSDRAPMTERKKEMIEGSRSEAQKEAGALAECLKDHEKPGAVLIKSVVEWVRQSAQGRVFDSDYELRKVMVECGTKVWPRRVKLYGRLQYVVVNDMLYDMLARDDEPGADLKLIRENIIKPSDLMEPTI